MNEYSKHQKQVFLDAEDYLRKSLGVKTVEEENKTKRNTKKQKFDEEFDADKEYEEWYSREKLGC